MNQDLKELLTLCSIEYESSQEDLLEATQKRWLIDSNDMEHIEGATYPLASSKRIKELAYKLGYGEEKAPGQLGYDYVIFLGGETETMMPRLLYLEKLSQLGIQLSTLIFHAGEHSLPSYDRNKNVTELKALQKLYQQAGLAKKFSQMAHHWIAIPLQNGRNPNTADGIITWLAHKPRPGSCLVISSQPYIRYQHEIFKMYMPSSFTIETVGPACDTAVPVSEILDSITRHFHQQHCNLKTPI